MPCARVGLARVGEVAMPLICNYCSKNSVPGFINALVRGLAHGLEIGLSGQRDPQGMCDSIEGG